MLPFRTRAVRVHFVLSSRNGVSEVVVVSIRNPKHRCADVFKHDRLRRRETNEIGFRSYVRA